MNVAGSGFLIFVFILSAFYFYLPGAAARRLALGIANGLVLWYLQPGLVPLAVLAAFLLSGYGVAVWLRARPNSIVLTGYLVLLLTAFMILKQYEFLTWILSPSLLHLAINIVGLSYLLFRQIHFIVDMMQGQIERPTLAGYLNYQLNFFAILSGPLQRYQDFIEYWSDPRPLLADCHELLMACLRLFTGIVKLGFIATFCLFYYNLLTPWLDQVIADPKLWNWPKGVLHCGAVFYLYPAYVYFNFSGYCDIVIAGASFIGLRLPENFDRPYLARNMIDFWTRWHATLTLWIRDYIFTPLYKAIATRWPNRAATLVFLCYFVALFLAGVWHGSTTNFALFGLAHGCGVATTKLWEDYLLRTRGRPGLREYMKSERVRWVAVLVTFHFVCFTFLFFSPDMCHRIFRLLRHEPGRQAGNGSLFFPAINMGQVLS